MRRKYFNLLSWKYFTTSCWCPLILLLQIVGNVHWTEMTQIESHMLELTRKKEIDLTSFLPSSAIGEFSGSSYLL